MHEYSQSLWALVTLVYIYIYGSISCVKQSRKEKGPPSIKQHTNCTATCYVQVLACVMCSCEPVLFAVLRSLYVQLLVCGMCRCWSLLCPVFGLCYARFAVCVKCRLQSRPSSLPSEHASLRSVGRMHACTYSKLVKTKVCVQFLWGIPSSKQPMRCRHTHMYIHRNDKGP